MLVILVQESPDPPRDRQIEKSPRSRKLGTVESPSIGGGVGANVASALFLFTEIPVS